MRTFTIQELENFSGLRAHTIRTWERRYGVLKPTRTSANFRTYTVDELESILRISFLNQKGSKISALARLSEDERSKALDAFTSDEDRVRRKIDCLVVKMYQMDVDGFEALLNECFLMWPCEVVVGQVILPFLQRVDLLFQGKRLNEEHLVVVTLRKKLLWSVEQIRSKTRLDKTVLLFLPFGRQLDLLLLYYYFQLKCQGYQVVYMGSDVSIENLDDIFSRHPIDYVLTYAQKKSTGAFLSNLSQTLKQHLPDSKILLLDAEENAVKAVTANVVSLQVADLLDFLTADRKTTMNLQLTA